MRLWHARRARTRATREKVRRNSGRDTILRREGHCDASSWRASSFRELRASMVNFHSYIPIGEAAGSCNSQDDGTEPRNRAALAQDDSTQKAATTQSITIDAGFVELQIGRAHV